MADNSIKEVVAALSEAQSVLVVSHKDPDMDAYASSLGLARGLRKLGKKTLVLNESGVLSAYRFIDNIDEIKTKIPADKYDLLVLVDCSDINRTGDNFKVGLTGLSRTINIDHHFFSNSRFADINLVQEKTSSASEMVFDVLCEMQVPLDKPLATLLLSGIYADTVSLQRGVSSSGTYQKLAQLFDAGADVARFADNFFWNRELAVVRFEADLILHHLKILENGRYAETVVTGEMFAKYGLNPKDCESIKDRATAVAGVMISAFIRFEDGLWKLSLRSKGRVDSNRVAKALGGGGHKGASAAKWKGSLEDLLSKLRAEISLELACNG